MDPLLFPVYLSAGIATLAAIVVVAAGKSTKPAASVLAVIAGLAPWIFSAIWHKWIPESQTLIIIGMTGSAPLFMAVFLHFGMGRKPDRWRTVSSACTVGMCAGLGYSYALYRLLCKMP